MAHYVIKVMHRGNEVVYEVEQFVNGSRSSFDYSFISNYSSLITAVTWIFETTEENDVKK